MSLRLRLALLTAGLLVGAVAAFSAILLWSERAALAEDQSRRQAEAAGGLAEVCRGAVVGQQDLLLTRYLMRLSALPEVREAACVDLGGRILGHTDLARVQGVDPELRSLAELPPGVSFVRGAGTVEVRAPVLVGDKRRGWVRVAYDAGRLRDRMESSLAAARRRIFRTSLWVIALGFVAAFLMTRWVMGSLTAVVEGVRVIAGGDLDHRIAVGGAEETALLSREFNAMAGKLSELDRMKSDFVNNVTHDLKSPLTAIKATVDVLQAGKSSAEDAAANFLSVRENADRLMNLITSILEVARIESGLVLDKRPVRLEDVAQRVVKTFRPLAKPKGLEVNLLVSADLAPLSGDESKLERLLANLVGNAVKFTEEGSVTVELGAGEGVQTVRVSDTGPGIPAEALDKLFTKFFRAAGKGRPVEGTGLGLTIAKGIAEAHGGTLAVESSAGKGTLFTLRLPA